ncbi:hypothetical protein NIES4071_64410 [Calothrix sp. NIES-4071]|nr:hypothetical protein NIES4071_64410 [Calothrix sp. NIES-4071]BAZ60745.1 hypothetical protein NIES4105_64370 [Calothrix sp. NIES-4105]
MNLNPQLQQLAEKYYLLMSIEEPSDDELHQLEEILELATIDEELNNLLLVVDEYIAVEVGLISKEQVIYKSWLSTLVSLFAKKNLSENTKKVVSLSILSVLSIGALLLLKQYDVTHVKLRYDTLSLVFDKALAFIQKQDADIAEQNSPQNVSLLEHQAEYESKKIDFQTTQFYFEEAQEHPLQSQNHGKT